MVKMIRTLLVVQDEPPILPLEQLLPTSLKTSTFGVLTLFGSLCHFGEFALSKWYGKMEFLMVKMITNVIDLILAPHHEHLIFLAEHNSQLLSVIKKTSAFGVSTLYLVILC